MKHILLVIGGLLLACFAVIYTSRFSHHLPNSLPTPITPTTETISNVDFDKRVLLENEEYSYRYVRIRPGTSIKLIPNFSKSQSTQTLVASASCSSAINAGYYTTQSLPLGFWDNGVDQFQTSGDNTFINSYVWQDSEKILHITDSKPQSYIFVFQTGPLLYQEGTQRILRIRSDEFARRSVIATLDDLSSIFITIYSPTSLFSGPYLAKLPVVLEKIAEQEELSIIDATNLDGGRASFFWNGDRFIDELTPVGSIMCTK